LARTVYGGVNNGGCHIEYGIVGVIIGKLIPGLVIVGGGILILVGSVIVGVLVGNVIVGRVIVGVCILVGVLVGIVIVGSVIVGGDVGGVVGVLVVGVAVVGVEVLEPGRVVAPLIVGNEHEDPVSCGGDTDPATHVFPPSNKFVVPNCVRYWYTPHGACIP
jgi:hypothetical protein